MASGTTARLGVPKLAGLVQVTDHLYLSNLRAANDIVMVSACKITCIINATEDAMNVAVPRVEYVRVPVADSSEARLADHFNAIADKIHRVAEQCGRTLVHCNAGVSRSAALCLAYLIRHNGMTLVEAHRRVKALRPIIRPNAGFWKQLIEYELKIHGKATVKMIMSPVGEVPDIYERQTRGLIPC